MGYRDVLGRLRAGEVLIADGATGTNLQQRGLLHGTPPEVWVVERPDEVLRLHRDFIAAGADLILTDTFGGTAVRLQHAGLPISAEEFNRQAAGLAREAAGDAGLVAGSMGPTGQLLEPLGPLTAAEAVAAYAAQARALAEGGVDLLVIETQFDLGEALAAVKGARSVTTLPLVCSFSYDMGTRTMMGLRPAQVAQELTAAGVDLVGINCGKSLDDNLANLEAARAATHLPLWMKPNAGLPHMGADDRPVYDVTPVMMGEHAGRWAAAGASVLGGCCGTTPDHLREIARAVRALPQPADQTDPL
jgi:5-methyltetrahydrofolate--homocysteine methyltransferase